MNKPQPIKPGPGQESVWDYPRPPRIEKVSENLRVVFNKIIVAETNRGLRVLETASAPVYYFPPEDVDDEVVQPVDRSSYCEWKGVAKYFDVCAGDRCASLAAWAYPAPTRSYIDLRGYIAFYAQKMDACYVAEEQVRPQPGLFYGGWVTNRIVGPIKGAPGTEHW